MLSIDQSIEASAPIVTVTDPLLDLEFMHTA